MKALAGCALMLVAASSAQAALSRAQLAGVSASLPASAFLDPAMAARDINGRTRHLGKILNGRPGFVLFVDYSCNTLCGTDLVLFSAAILKSGLKPNDYRIVVIGFDPKDSAASARAMEHNVLPRELTAATTFLLPDATAIAQATDAVGFRFVYDPILDQYAHPAVIYVVAPNGAVRAVLSPFALNPGDITSAIARSGRAPSLYERIRLLCYGYDSAVGIYSHRVVALLKDSAAATLGLLGLGIFLLIRKARRAR